MSSKSKGNIWERMVRDVLIEATGDHGFARVPNSGAIGTNYRKSGNMGQEITDLMSGDIISPKNFKYSLECKSYHDIPLHLILYGNCKLLDEWIEQASNDAKSANKKMLIFIKIDRKAKMVLYDSLEIEAEFDNYFMYKNRYVLVEMETFVAKIINTIKKVAENV